MLIFVHFYQTPMLPTTSTYASTQGNWTSLAVPSEFIYAPLLIGRKTLLGSLSWTHAAAEFSLYAHVSRLPSQHTIRSCKS